MDKSFNFRTRNFSTTEKTPSEARPRSATIANLATSLVGYFVHNRDPQ